MMGSGFMDEPFPRMNMNRKSYLFKIYLSSRANADETRTWRGSASVLRRGDPGFQNDERLRSRQFYRKRNPRQGHVCCYNINFRLVFTLFS